MIGPIDAFSKLEFASLLLRLYLCARTQTDQKCTESWLKPRNEAKNLLPVLLKTFTLIAFGITKEVDGCLLKVTGNS